MPTESNVTRNRAVYASSANVFWSSIPRRKANRRRIKCICICTLQPCVCSTVALTKTSFKQTDAPPHEIGEDERTLNAHLADNRDFTEGIRVTLGNRAMT
eukprot:scaffold647_cov70-Phaeocystis_antarctica.AAC.12